jgi:CDP-paratose 2-epimerase
MKILITGGAGFIGCNIAKRYLEKGCEVSILDNLSRKGSEKNLEWLRGLGKIDLHKVDLSDADAAFAAVDRASKPDIIFHMAAQVAVTTSVTDPRSDFNANALGTFNLLEAVRHQGLDPVIIYASTNKVYGEMTDLGVTEKGGRYQYASLDKGIPESRQLDFHSPYGCSKGCADQYMIDYGRIYGLKTVCMRQSCIYGPRQFGVEDQGWVAWFTIAAALGKPVTIYGDGKQVRDVLHVNDLIDLFDLAAANIDRVKGKAFNVGGGPVNQMSLLELLAMLEKISGRGIETSYESWRPGDQKIYVSDIRRVKEELGWAPGTTKEEGIRMLWEWVDGNKALFSE